ncbi:ABC transporter substrate-binding protein [Herbidospora yilanensis]|uniref:ABC transporter substrate-binding protein n=1 Tax=Herbidospora yilanensis TaxID=354426 RepID=UPI0018DC5CDE|nr:ABC transporter substrate-binding protein [Herbidospora yilanensis]
MTTALLTACAGAREPSAPAAGGGSGGLTIAVSSFQACLDVALSGGRNSTVTHQILDTLTDQDPKTGEIVPRLAEKWEVNDEFTEFTFHLRKGVTFSDGTPLDAQVVADNFTKLAELITLAKSDTLVLNALNSFQSAEAVDPSTVRLTFKLPELGFLRNASDPYLAILSQATLAKTPEQRCAGELVGTGPFVFDKIVKDKSIVLKRRDDYNWSAAGVAGHQGAAYLPSVTFEAVPESSVRVGGLTSGQFDISDDIPVTDLAQLRDAGQTIVSKVVPNLVPGMRPNPYSPLGSDDAVRRAVQKGIDRAEITGTLYPEIYQTPSSIVSSTTAGWKDFGTDLAYDPEGAKKLLDEAGWVAGADGVRAKDGVRLAPKITYIVGNFFGATQQELELVQQQLGRIGIAVEIKANTPADNAAMLKDISKADYDFLTGSGASKDIDFLAGLFKKSNAALLNAEQPELEAKADALNEAATPEARTAAAQELQHYTIEHGHWIPLREQTKVVAVSPAVSGYLLDTYAAHFLYDTKLAG